MTKLVRFTTPKGDCAVPVEQVTEVRLATGMRPLPAPRDGVVGLLARDDEALPVLAVLGSGGQHVVVVDDGDMVFGLLVDEVVGVHDVDDDRIQPPPAGQDREVVAGVVGADGALVLMLDLQVLRGRLIG